MNDLADLVERARRGDAAALEALLARNLPALRAFIRLRSNRLLRTRESVSDLAQSVCREVLRDLPSFPVASEPAFRHWLYTSALRKILDRRKYWETEKRDPRCEVSLDSDERPEHADALAATYRGFCSPSQHASLREQIERVEAAFDELPDDYREVLTLARVVGLSHREIAERLGRSEVAARQLLSRARARLARLLS
jgi:RNA polymerase sigma-70 factor (ECF subfamily)